MTAHRMSPDTAVATLLELVLKNEILGQDDVAFRFVGCRGFEMLTYAAVASEAREVAAWIQSFDPNRRPVGIMLPTGSDFVSAFFACVMAGVPAVPLATPRTDAQASTVSDIAARANASAVLTDRATLQRLSQRVPTAGAIADWRFHCIEDCRGDSSAWRMPTSTPSSPAVLQFTSGSTGRARGVVVTHANVLYYQSMIYLGFRHAHDAVVVGWLPLFHDMGLIGNLLNPFWMRRPCILLPPQAFLRNPRAWLEAISHYRATTSGGPTFAFEHCADRIDGDLSDLDLSSWRVAFVGAEPVRAAALARFARRFAPAGFVRSAFYPCYGLAEATLIVTGANRSAAPEAPPTDSGQGIVEEGTGSQKDTVGCGVALGGQAVAIVHPERLDECRPGETGEVWIAGSAVAAGYVADPESTQATFGGRLSDGRGPYLRTGDLGTMSNGQLFVQGRLKNLVIVAGTNIVAEDVEAWIGGCHPSIVPSAVAAYAIGDGGREALAVALEIRRDAERSSAFAEIVDSVRARAAELVDVPVSEVVLYRAGGLPRTTSGKLQRWRCATPESDDDQRIIHRSILIGNDVRSRNAGLGSIARDSYAIQTWLQERVARVLGTEAARVSSNAAFAHLGLSSADALAVTHELGLALGLELENTLFWEYPTIGSVAAYLSGDSQ